MNGKFEEFNDEVLYVDLIYWHTNCYDTDASCTTLVTPVFCAQVHHENDGEMLDNTRH